MNNEVIVRVKILSETRTPDQITQFVGIAPDKSWRIGDKRAKSSIVEGKHGWLLHSGLAKSASLEAHISALTSLLLPHASKIKELSRDDAVEFSIVIYASSPPSLFFSKETIATISQLGANFDIDLYIVPSQEG